MSFIDFIVRGSYSSVVTEWNKPYEPKLVPPSHDARKYEQIGVQKLNYSQSDRDAYVFKPMDANDKSVLMTISFDADGTKHKLSQIWNKYSEYSFQIHSLSNLGAICSVFFGAFQYYKGNSFRNSLISTVCFTLLSYVAHTRGYSAQELHEKHNPHFGDWMLRVDNIRNIVFAQGLERYHGASQGNNNFGYSSPFFSNHEKAFLIAKYLDDDNTKSFYEKLLTHDIDALFSKVILLLRDNPSFDHLKAELFKEENPELLALLKTASIFKDL